MARNPLSLTNTAIQVGTLVGGGRGISVEVDEDPSVAVLFACAQGEVFSVANEGPDTFWFEFGTDNTIRATLAGTPVFAGTKEIFTMPDIDDKRGELPFVWVSCVTRDSGEALATFNYLSIGS